MKTPKELHAYGKYLTMRSKKFGVDSELITLAHKGLGQAAVLTRMGYENHCLNLAKDYFWNLILNNQDKLPENELTTENFTL
jgi:hypothetical protein